MKSFFVAACVAAGAMFAFSPGEAEAGCGYGGYGGYGYSYGSPAFAQPIYSSRVRANRVYNYGYSPYVGRSFDRSFNRNFNRSFNRRGSGFVIQTPGFGFGARF